MLTFLVDAGWGNPDWTANDPEFESLHEYARFGEILARMRGFGEGHSTGPGAS